MKKKQGDKTAQLLTTVRDAYAELKEMRDAETDGLTRTRLNTALNGIEDARVALTSIKGKG